MNARFILAFLFSLGLAMAFSLGDARPAVSAASPGVLSLSAAQVFDPQDPLPAQPATEFSSKSSASLDLLVKVKLSTTDSKPRRIGVFAALSDEDGTVLNKIKEAHDQMPGESEYRFSDLLSLTSLLGDRNYTLDIEISAKGFASAKQKIRLTLHGAPPPELALDSLRFFNSKGKPTDYFEPGEAINIELRFHISANSTSVQPKLSLSSGLINSYSAAYSASSSEVLSSGESGSRLLAAGAKGSYLLRVSGRLPKYFDEAAQDQHAFGLLARIYFGDEQFGWINRTGVVLDGRSSGERSKKGYTDRSFSLQDSTQWSLEQPDDD